MADGTEIGLTSKLGDLKILFDDSTRTFKMSTVKGDVTYTVKIRGELSDYSRT